MACKLKTEIFIKNLLNEIHEPYTNETLGKINAIKNIEISETGNKIFLEFGFPLMGVENKLKERVNSELEKADLPPAEISIKSKVTTRAVQRGVPILDNVKNIIAVASGK